MDLQSITVGHDAAEQPAASATGTAVANQLQLVSMAATAGQPRVGAVAAAAAAVADGGLRQRRGFMSRLSRSSKRQKSLAGEVKNLGFLCGIWQTWVFGGIWQT